MKIGVVDNPLDPSTWTEYDAEDAAAFFPTIFPTWPSTAKVFDLSGMGDWTRVAGAMDDSLNSRDVTPRRESIDADLARLSRLAGPVMVVVMPANLGNVLSFVISGLFGLAMSLLKPKVTVPEHTTASPNNQLSDRTNQARPFGRIPDIFGTVRSTPDLIALPYRVFENNLELDVAYMCVGRGQYEITDVRDGTTPIESISGAAAIFYGPFSSPNFGTPQLQIGSPIAQPLLTVEKQNEVNGQILRPPNSNYYRASSDLRFVAPDRIQSISSIDFTTLFAADDLLTVGDADFGATVTYDATTQVCRFYPDKRIEFQSFDPTTMFFADQTIVITNAGYAALDVDGNVLFVDVSGTEIIDSVTSTVIQLKA